MSFKSYQDEALQVLKREGAMSGPELARHLGIARSYCHKVLVPLVASNQVCIVAKVDRERSHGKGLSVYDLVDHRPAPVPPLHPIMRWAVGADRVAPVVNL